MKLEKEFLLPRFSQVRNLYVFFSLGVKDEYPTMMTALQGSDVAQEHLRLDTLPNTTTDLFGI